MQNNEDEGEEEDEDFDRGEVGRQTQVERLQPWQVRVPARRLYSFINPRLRKKEREGEVADGGLYR